MAAISRGLLFIALTAALVLAVSVAPATAQGSQRPYRGLFGGGQGLNTRPHVLDVTGSLYTAFITTDQNQPTGSDIDQIPADSLFAGANTSIVYTRNWSRSAVGAYAAGGGSYVTDYLQGEESNWIKRWQAGGFAGTTRPLGNRTTGSLYGGGLYSPYYGLGSGVPGLGAGNVGIGGIGGVGVGGIGGIPSVPPGGGGSSDVAPIPGLDYGLTRAPNVNLYGLGQITRQLTLRSSLDFYGSGGEVTFINPPPEAGLENQYQYRVGGRYRYQLKQYLSVRAGYGYRWAHYGQPGQKPVHSHDIDVGVDGGYGKTFNLTRTTTFGFGTHANVFVTETIDPDGGSDTNPNLFVGGNATLAQQIGQTWRGQLMYNRSAGLQTGFTDVVVSNQVSATLNGLISRRVELDAGVYYTTGTVGFGTGDSNYHNTSAQAQVRTAITRLASVFAQYFFYQYEYGNGVSVPFGLPPTLSRRGGVVGLSLWLPLI